ncbi:MAG: DUF3237 family protein [Clostridia bacterium]|nr:DUF3237 family protein [Clostridia bacterium]
MKEELILTIHVLCTGAEAVKGRREDVVMVPFTGRAQGPDFTGETVGPGVDTQRIAKDGTVRLSARYMLAGRDSAGNSCRLFVENQSGEDGVLRPRIVTDSPVLAAWEDARLRSAVEGAPGGVTVRIWRETEA